MSKKHAPGASTQRSTRLRGSQTVILWDRCKKAPLKSLEGTHGESADSFQGTDLARGAIVLLFLETETLPLRMGSCSEIQE